MLSIIYNCLNFLFPFLTSQKESYQKLQICIFQQPLQLFFLLSFLLLFFVVVAVLHFILRQSLWSLVSLLNLRFCQSNKPAWSKPHLCLLNSRVTGRITFLALHFVFNQNSQMNFFFFFKDRCALQPRLSWNLSPSASASQARVTTPSSCTHLFWGDFLLRYHHLYDTAYKHSTQACRFSICTLILSFFLLRCLIMLFRLVSNLWAQVILLPELLKYLATALAIQW